jgi:uncharacterized cupin superfamily protein
MVEGWFVINVADARWVAREGFGRRCQFEPEDAKFEQIGIQISVIAAGDHSTLYHAEDSQQEGFLVLSGACLAILEDEERQLRQWDFVHCPPGTQHVFVNTGDEPCALLMVGARVGGGIVYPVSEAALAHGAGVETEAHSANDAYAGLPPWAPTDQPSGWPNATS